MRKFKVVKHWPCGPLVGETLKMTEGGTQLEQYPEARWSFPYVEIKDYIEEVKEPEWTWYINPMGGVCRVDTFATPDWLRFKSKEDCERFREALKESHKLGFEMTPLRLFHSLDQRVTK